MAEMLVLIPTTPVTIWSWVRRGIFPRPLKVSKRVFWPQSVYDAWKAKLPYAKYKGNNGDNGEA